MSGDPVSGVGEVLPNDAWTILEQDPSCKLIDVRTRAEWGFVGVPDLSGLDQEPLFVEWAIWPDMSINPRFVAELQDALAGQVPGTLLFLCRSGARSLRAADAVLQAFARNGHSVRCLNVAEGFEGDLDPDNHRGRHNGWQARGLAWRQS